MSEVPEYRAEKLIFAEYLARQPKDAFGAGLAAWPNNVNMAAYCARYWPSDPLVQQEIQRLQASQGPGYGLADKGELLRLIWERMTAERLADGSVNVLAPDDLVKLAKLYAEVRGYIERPAATPLVNVSVPRAIEVPVHESDEAWERAAQKQQRELLHVSRDRT